MAKSGNLSVLDEANVGGLLAEALTADVEAVLANETGFVGADAAAAGTLAVVARARVPDGFVRHDERLCRWIGCWSVGRA